MITVPAITVVRAHAIAPLAVAPVTRAGTPKARAPVTWSGELPVLATAPMTCAWPLAGSTITQTLLTFRLPVTPAPALGLTVWLAELNPVPHPVTVGAAASSRSAAAARPARLRRPERAARRGAIGACSSVTFGPAPWYAARKVGRAKQRHGVVIGSPLIRAGSAESVGVAGGAAGRDARDDLRIHPKGRSLACPRVWITRLLDQS
jgi:hypothetical protein